MLAGAHAKHSDLLQIADVVAGCVAEFCEYNFGGSSAWGKLPERAYPDDDLGIIASSFRRGARTRGSEGRASTSSRLLTSHATR